jgi:hypothetical protein
MPLRKSLIYNFSGELDEITHLFPSERLARLAAIARAAGAEATVVDRANFTDLLRFGPEFMEQLGKLSFHETNPGYRRTVAAEARRVLDEDADAIFVNLWHGTGFKFSMDLLARLKAAQPRLRIYGVGQKVDWFTDQIFRVAGGRIDGLLTGLGFGAMQRLAAGAEPERVPGVLRPDGGMARQPVTRVDDYPGPEYRPEVYPRIRAKIPVFSVCLSNQACPGRCAFCVRPSNYGRRAVRRDPHAVVAELRLLHDAHGATHFRIEDSTPPSGALTAVAQAILRSDLRGKIRLSGFARVDSNAREDFDAVREAGVISLFFGLESLCDETLVRLRKGITYRAIRETLGRARRAGLRTVGSLIFPTPGEDRRSMQATLTRLRALRPLLDSVVVLPAGVYATTEWGRRPAEHGIRLAADYGEEALIYPIRYLVPMREWKPLPFTYDLMGRPAEKVSFSDIVDVQEAFLREVRGPLDLPGIPDYYFLLADRIGADPAEAARGIVDRIMRRDYSGLRSLCMP